MSLRQTPTSITDNAEPRSRATTRISGRWLLAARVSLIIMSALVLVIYVFGTPVFFVKLSSLSAVCQSLGECLNSAQEKALHTLGLSSTTYAVYWVAVNVLFSLVYMSVALLIVWRKSDDRMALFASFSLVAFGASFTSIPTVLASIYPAWWLPVALLEAIGFPSLTVFLFVFPNGRFVPRWMSWVALGWTVLYVLKTFFPDSLINFNNSLRLLRLLIPLIVLGSIVLGQVYRYRRFSTLIERQQTKWVILGLSIALLGFLLLGFLPPFLSANRLPFLPLSFLITSNYLVLLLIPLSIAIAVLRYRLWDVDVLINRTLVYGSLTVILTLFYFGLIFALQSLFQGLFKQNNAVAIVVSTLVIAALFQPLRHRLQQFIDRRFYRSKYDAAKTLEAFSATLRNEVDLGELREQLLNVVQETMQPAHVSLWLRSPERHTEEPLRKE
jgi:hypothetical protein